MKNHLAQKTSPVPILTSGSLLLAPPSRRRGGFTLVELLVVIGIIVILIAILMPALARARYEARMTLCMANQRSLVHAMMLYANDNNGFFPREDGPFGVGDNANVVSPAFWTLMTKTYSIPQSNMFCPFEPDEDVAQYATYLPQFGIYMLGYGLWVPRSDTYRGGWGVFPPAASGGSFAVYDPTGSSAGPAMATDHIAATVPVLTDIVNTVYLTGTVPPAPPLKLTDPSISRSDLTFTYWHLDPAAYAGAINEAFADGHVERRQAGELVFEYSQGPFDDWR